MSDGQVGLTRDPLLDFSGKVALVTGAARGFGRLLASELASRGARLVLGDVNTAGLDSMREGLLNQGVEVVTQNCDVSRAADCEALVAAAIERFGTLDIAVNNAGIAHEMQLLEELSDEVFERQWAVNLRGVQWGMKYQLQQMKRQQGGVILNVSSMAGITGAPRCAAYAAAKHAVIGLTRSVAVEVARDNIRVNAICPFFTATAMVTESSFVKARGLDSAAEALTRSSPMHRLGQPMEIVSVMLLLLSPGNTFMTGQAIAVDGGMSAL